MILQATLQPVHNRGNPKRDFIVEMVEWAMTAPDEIFAPNTNSDIYNRVNGELSNNGKWDDLLHRKSAMLEVMRVLAGFESSWNWNEGIDASRSSATNNENAEAGAWQESWDARKLDASLRKFLADHGIGDGVEFQQRMKREHSLAMEFVARLLRIDVSNFERISNGPVRKGAEREKTWPNRPNLWDERESIYPHLSRAAMEEFRSLVSTVKQG